jgi:endonuclease/exonuclease/phosphatase (EEP) superfamily protein YafD
MLFQEAHFLFGKGCIVQDFSFEAAANLELNQEYYGVLTASKTVASKAKAFLSEKREAFFGTHKSLLLSTYPFMHGKKLLIVNIHAINFRENHAYEKEKKRLLNYLASYSGALIVAGDFNTWSGSRLKILLDITEELGLKKVPFETEKGVKSFWGNHLDMIFYRGLELQEYRVYDDEGISDHRPLFARFSLRKDPPVSISS